MPDKVTKKQVMQHLKTPYAKLEIGGEGFSETYKYQPGQRHKTEYEHLIIEANPFATAWRVTRTVFFSDTSLVQFDEAIKIASEYIEDNWLTWGDWKMTQTAEQYPKCKRPKTWGEANSLLKNDAPYSFFYEDTEDKDVSFYISRYFNDGVWQVNAGNGTESVELYRLKDVIKNIRSFSSLYSLSASDWCYSDWCYEE